MSTTVFGEKQPSEEYAVRFDFTQYLGAETISTATVTATDMADGSDVTATVTDVGAQVITSPHVYVWVRAGTSGHSYTITCQVVTDGLSEYELDGILPVEEEPEAPWSEPVSLTEAKLHLRLATTAAAAEAYTSEDDLLQALIAVAREQVQLYTGRSMVTETRTLYLRDWPDGDYIELPYPPLQSVTGIYYTALGDTVETEFTDFGVNTALEPGRAVLDYGCTWPSDTLEPASSIRVVYVAGYGVAEDVPASIKAAVKLVLTDLYEHRGEIVVGASVERIPAVHALLAPYRVWSHL